MRSPTPGSRAATSPGSGSPTSARPSSPGTPTAGEPLHRALVWQDRRTADRCAELKEAGHEDLVRERTGLVLDPYFSGTKIEWLLRNADGMRARRLRDDRLVAGLQAHRAPRHRLHERVAHAALRHPQARVGPRAVRAARRGPGEAARGAPVRRGLRHDDGVRRRGAGGGDRRRPAGGALRPGLPPRRDGEEHLRHRAASSCSTSASEAPEPREGILTTVAWGLESGDRLRARGGGLRHRRRGPVASRRARGHRRRRRDRGARRGRSTPTTASTSCPR